MASSLKDLTLYLDMTELMLIWQSVIPLQTHQC